jgi:hypothetical protein
MKIALFGFNGDPMCFVHVMLNALDLAERGHDVALVVEGSATKLVKTFADDPQAPFANLYRKVKDAGLVAGVCRACATKMGSKEAAESQGLALLGDMSGHPGVAPFLEGGYTVLTF